MAEINQREQGKRPERLKPWMLTTAAVGGLAVAAASGAYIVSHHVRTPEEAVFSITWGEAVVAHIDSGEVAAGLAGIGGLLISSVAASETLLRSHQDKE